MESTSIFKETGLIINPSTDTDLQLLKNYFDNSDYYAEYNEENNCFMAPESEDLIDMLEMELTYLFNDMGISVSFELNIVPSTQSPPPQVISKAPEFLIKVCEVCGSGFPKKTTWHRFCSTKCRKQANDKGKK
jgi:hypothetical protein